MELLWNRRRRPPIIRRVSRSANAIHNNPSILDRAGAAILAAAGLAIGLIFAHRGLYNDGIFFVQWLSEWELSPGEKHVWLYPHLLYLPAAKGFHLFLNLFHETRIDESLKLFSAFFMGGAGPFLWRLFRTFTNPVLALAGGFLVFLAPSVWYFAGATEIHTIHLAAAAFALSAAAKPYKKFATLAFVAGALWVQTTHLTGFFIIPAMLLLNERARSGNPRSLAELLSVQKLISLVKLALICGLAIGATAGIAWFLHIQFENYSVLKEYFPDVHPGGQDKLKTIWIELIIRSGVLVPAGLLGAVLAFRKEPLAALAVFVTFPPYAYFIGNSQVEYQGGYNIPATVVWTLGLILSLQIFSARIATAVAAVLLVIQGAVGFIEVRKPAFHDLNRETAEAIGAVAKKDDALILYIPPSAVDFDITQLPNLTRLYLSRVLLNAAMLDSKNGAQPPKAYLTESGAADYAEKIQNEIRAALAAGRRAFISFEIWDPPADAPNLQKLSRALRDHYNSGDRHDPPRLLELKKN